MSEQPEPANAEPGGADWRKESLSARALYYVEMPVFGPGGAGWRRIRRWLLRLAEIQAAAWRTSVEGFRKEHFDPAKLRAAAGLSAAQVHEHSHISKVDQGTVEVMQRLVAQYSLSSWSAKGKAGSEVYAPTVIAAALLTLRGNGPHEDDWEYLLFSALLELVRGRYALDGDARIALDAAYIVVTYLRLLPAEQNASRFFDGCTDELIIARVSEAEASLAQLLPWK